MIPQDRSVHQHIYYVKTPESFGEKEPYSILLAELALPMLQSLLNNKSICEKVP